MEQLHARIGTLIFRLNSVEEEASVTYGQDNVHYTWQTSKSWMARGYRNFLGHGVVI